MVFTPEVVKDICRRLRELNPEPQPKYAKSYPYSVAIWQAKHPDKYKIYKKKYDSSERGRETASIRNGKRRALKLGCKGSHTILEWLIRQAQYGYRCAYCHKKRKYLTKDHIVPLTKGGTDYIHNIVPACRKCNSSKYNTNILTWDKFNSLQLPLNPN